MKKCDCYCEGVKSYYLFDQHTGQYTGDASRTYGYCMGTKEQDECSCGGDRTKCDFYPDIKEKAIKETNASFYCNYDEVAIGKIDLNPYKTLTIDAEMIKLHQKDLDITIDVPNDFLDKIENIEVNGFKFVKDKNND